jgi:hypothetical protein
MGSNRQTVIDFVVLNHDEDLLALLKMDWLVDAVSTRKNDEVKGTAIDRPLVAAGNTGRESVLVAPGAVFSGHGRAYRA